MNLFSELFERIEVANIWLKNITLLRDQYLKVKGSKDTNIYYIQSGALIVSLLDDHEEHIIRFGYKGSFVAALDSFISEKPSPYYIKALKKSELKVLSKDVLNDFIHNDGENQRLWLLIMENLILQQMEREVDILISSPQERYLRILHRSPQLFQEVPHKYIASYLRMAPETLSRLKKS